MDLAIQAVRLAPDHPPAIDAVLSVQVPTKELSRTAFDAFVQRSMEATHDRGVLVRAAGITLPQWGGRGAPEVAQLCETYAPLVEGVEGCTPEVCLADVISYHPFGHERAVTAATIMDSDPSLFDPVRRARAMLSGSVGEPEAEALRDLILDPTFTDVDLARTYDMNVAVRRGWPTLSPEVHERARAEAEARFAYDPKNLEVIDTLLSPPPMAVFVAGRMPPEPDPAAIERLARARIKAAPYDPRSWSALSGTATDKGVPLDPIHGIASANMVAYGNHKPDYLTMSATNRSNLFVSLPPGEARDALACELVRADRLLREVCSAVGSSEWWCSQTDFSQPYWQDALDHAKSGNLCAWDREAPLPMIAFRPRPLPPE